METYVSTTSVLGAAVALPVIATVVVILRYISRSHSKQGLGWDDAFSVVALVFTWGMAACYIHGVRERAIGVHSVPTEFTVGPKAETAAAQHRFFLQYKLDYALNMLYVLAIGSIRMTALMLYQRIFKDRSFQIFNWIMVGIVAAWTVTFFIVDATLCHGHPQAYWDLNSPYRDLCTGNNAEQNALAVSNIILDGIVVLMPVLPVLRLQMPSGRKSLILGIFFLGLFATACAIARCVFLFAFADKRFDVIGLPRSDAMGIYSVLEFWILIEAGVACVTCNLPAIPGAFKTEYFQRLRSWATGSSSSLTRPANNKQPVVTEKVKQIETA